MNILTVLQHLYTNRKPHWIKDVEENQIQPYVIQRWLCMNDMLRVQTRWLDKYVFVLQPKMYLSLAWSIIPKVNRMPYNKYIKAQSEEEEFEFILSKIRKHFNLADNDYNAMKGRLIKEIKNNMVDWFSFYGVPKKYWKQYYLDFNLIKKFGQLRNVGQAGLEKWGL